VTSGLRAVVIGCVFAIAGVSPARAAITDYLGKPVAAVRFVVEGRDTADPSLSDLVETRVGRPVSMTDVRESLAHLYNLGRFEDVRVDASLEAAGVTIRYDLSPVHPVSGVAFTWKPVAPGVDEDRLRRAVAERGGSSLRVGRAAELALAVKDALRERGYLNAAVTPGVQVSHAPHTTTLVFTIEPGPRTVLGTLNVTGSPGVPVPDVLKQLGLAPGAPYESGELNARIEKYLSGVRSRGYYEARVMPAVSLADGDRVANLTVAVERGPHVRVVFAGDPLPENRHADLVPVEREASVSEDLLEDSTNRIAEFLRAQGYRDAAAPHTRIEMDGELTVTFKVSRGPAFRVARVDISGTSALALSTFEAGLRLRGGLPYSAAALDADVAAIEDAYRRSGFVGVKADSGVEPQAAAPGAPIPVVVRIIVREGVQTLVGAVTFGGNQAVNEAAMRELVTLKTGAAFVPAQLAADREAILLRYLNLGFENAAVDVKPDVTRDGTRTDLLFTVREGVQILVDHVIIVGNARTSTETIEQELQLRAGDPLGREAMFESQRRLSALGLFRRVTVTAVGHGDERRRDLLVSVDEAAMTTMAYGGGLEGGRKIVQEVNGQAGERFEFAPRASIELARRNLFGKNRSATLFANGSLPLRVSGDPTAATETSIAQYRVGGTYREPRVFDTQADAFIDVTSEQQVRSSFDFRRSGANVALARRFSPAVTVSGGYQIQRTETFNLPISLTDQSLINRVFSTYRLSSFLASIAHDTRNDPIDATSGQLFSVDGQLAAQAIGSEIGFIKSRFTAQMFRMLPKAHRTVFAASARLGLATGFPHPVRDKNHEIVVGPDGEPIITEDLDLSSRFYAGGDTTVRGFALDAVGIRHDPADPTVDTLDKNGFPVGGNAVLILNGELRAPVRGGLQAVGFVDTGQVFQRVTKMDLGELRTAAGIGLRYKSPIGPIRFDLGFKLFGLQSFVVENPPAPPTRQEEGRMEWFVTFGQAF
jgi:outer membrane protein insertion porin family